MTIAIVDDNPTNLIIVEEILKKAGYRQMVKLPSAASLFEHLMLTDDAAESDVDLILMDLMMPEVDGIEACRAIQRQARLRDIPIIIVTAIGDSKKLAEALDAGASDFVTKPINKIELLARIRVALRLKFEKDRHKERDKKISGELELAKQVQASMLSAPIQNDHIHIQAAYYPSFELAGDLYAWYRIDRRRYGVILLDMMGHGISSSLVCMFITSVMKETIIRLSDPEQVVRELNRYMNQLFLKKSESQYYFTAIYLVIDIGQQTIEYVNAGHPPGVLFSKDGAMTPLDQGCCAVGLFPQIEIKKTTLRYEPGDSLFLYTDGVMDSFAPYTEDDPTERMMDGLSEGRRANPNEWIERFVMKDNPGPHPDDMCLVKIDLLSPSPGKVSP